MFGLVGGGGQAEYVVTHERLVAGIPTNLDFVQAAAVPEAFITGHDALVTQGRVLPGERVLIHAVGSGVGTAAVQLAHAMGCEVWGTSRKADKLEKMKPFGLDHGIDTSHEDFADAVKASSVGRGVDVLIDLLGKRHSCAREPQPGLSSSRPRADWCWWGCSAAARPRST